MNFVGLPVIPMGDDWEEDFRSDSEEEEEELKKDVKGDLKEALKVDLTRDLKEDLSEESSEDDSDQFDDDDDPISEKKLLAMTRSIMKPEGGRTEPRTTRRVRFKFNSEQKERQNTKGSYRERFDYQKVAKRKRKGKVDLKISASKLFTTEMVERFAESLRMTPEGYSSDSLPWVTEKKKKKKKVAGPGSSNGTGEGSPKKKQGSGTGTAAKAKGTPPKGHPEKVSPGEDVNATGAAKVNGTSTPRLNGQPGKVLSGGQAADLGKVKTEGLRRGKTNVGKEAPPVPVVKDSPDPAKKPGMLNSFSEWVYNGKSKEFRREYNIFMEQLRQFQLKEMSVAYLTKDDVAVPRPRYRAASIQDPYAAERNAKINGDTWVHLQKMRPLITP